MELNMLRKCINDVIETTTNEQISKVFKSIDEQRNLDEDEYSSLIAIKINELLMISLDNWIEVIQLISNIMKIISNRLIYIKFAKINFKILHNNFQSTRSTIYPDDFIQILCQKIIQSFDTDLTSESKKFVKIQMKIIYELQKVYNEYLGNKYIINLFIKLINADICDLEECLTNILNKQLENSQFYKELLTFESCSDYWRYCLLILQNLKHNNSLLDAISTSNKDTNFICMLILKVSQQLDVMDTDGDIFDILVQELAYLIAQDVNFKVIEEFLIEGTIGDDYQLSIVCFYTFCHFLISIKLIDSLKSYFILFQDILLAIWKPYLDFNENRQMLIAEYVKILYNLHQESLTALIKPELCVFLTDVSQNLPIKSANLIENFSILKSNPTVQNYYNFIEALQFDEIHDDQSQKSLIEVIEMAGLCEWNVHEPFVSKVIKLIGSTTDHEKKMMYLLKFDPLSSINLKMENVSLGIVHKLLKMVMTFMSRTSGCDGLKNYIKNLLDVLLEIDVSVRRLYLNLRQSKTVMINENETLIGDIEGRLKIPISLKHECQNSDNDDVIDEETQMNELNKMLSYSKDLSSQKLSSSKVKIINEIIVNLQKAVHSSRLNGSRK